MVTFSKATKEQAKLRCAIFGPSGAGKTYTALRIAKGIGGKTAVIDTEHGSASKYADRFDFDTCHLTESQTIDAYIDALLAAGQAGYSNVVIDSLSHGWQELLAEVEKLANAKYKGNTWSAWSEGTPKQKALVNAILRYPGHVIATIRSKTAWEQEKDERSGKSRPVRIGLAPEQGKGIEYEFDLLIEMTVDHIANVIKDRTGKYQDKLIEKPGEDFGASLAAWLSEGSVPVIRPVDKRAIADAFKASGVQPGDIKAIVAEWCAQQGVEKYEDANADSQQVLLADIKAGAYARQNV